MIISHEYARLNTVDQPTRRTPIDVQRSPIDVLLTPWTAAGVHSDPATHFYLPRAQLTSFDKGFLVAWNGATADRNLQLLRRLEDAVQYVVGFHGYLQRRVGDAASPLLLLEASPGERARCEPRELGGVEGLWRRLVKGQARLPQRLAMVQECARECVRRAGGGLPPAGGNPEQWEWEGGDWMRATMQGWRSDDYG